MGPAGARRGEPGRPGHRGALLPRPPHERQHRLRRDALPRHRGQGRPSASAVLLLAARRRARAARRAGRGRRDHHHRAGGRRHPPGRRLGRRRRGGLGRGRARRARPADPPGALPDLVARRLGGQRRRPLPAGHRDAGRRPRVRRPADHRPVLVQGAGRGRPDRLRGRPRARRPGRRDRGAARPAAVHPGRRAPARAGAVRVPDQARPGRQRGRPGHPRERDAAAHPAARGGHGPRPAGRPRRTARPGAGSRGGR